MVKRFLFDGIYRQSADLPVKGELRPAVLIVSYLTESAVSFRNMTVMRTETANEFFSVAG